MGCGVLPVAGVAVGFIGVLTLVGVMVGVDAVGKGTGESKTPL